MNKRNLLASDVELMKTALRRSGQNLPFYESIDSYQKEFQRTTASALRECKSLLSIDQVSDEEYQLFSSLIVRRYPALKPTMSNLPEEQIGYGEFDREASLAGLTAIFIDPQGNFKTAIAIRKVLPSIRSLDSDVDLEFGCKLASLYHELAHVHDLENGINFNADGTVSDVRKIEIFAHCKTLERLDSMCMGALYDYYYSAIEKYRDLSDYRGEIAREVLSNHPKRLVKTWRNSNSSLPSDSNQ